MENKTLITTNGLVDSAVTEEKIADNSISTDKIKEDSITTSKIPDGAVNGDKISNTSITLDKLAPDVITELKDIPQSIKVADYTLALEDAGNHILHPSADTTARTITIPSNASVAFPIGTVITIVNQNIAGELTISITSDILRLAGLGTTGNRTIAANGIATIIKITTTEWLISGAGVS